MTPDYYYYLNQSGTYKVDGTNDSKDFQETMVHILINIIMPHYVCHLHKPNTSRVAQFVSFCHFLDLCWPWVLMTWSTGSHAGDWHIADGSEASAADCSWHLTSGRHQFHWGGKLRAGGEHRLWVIYRWSKCFPVCCLEITIDSHNSDNFCQTFYWPCFQPSIGFPCLPAGNRPEPSTRETHQQENGFQMGW